MSINEIITRKLSNGDEIEIHLSDKGIKVLSFGDYKENRLLIGRKSFTVRDLTGRLK